MEDPIKAIEEIFKKADQIFKFLDVKVINLEKGRAVVEIPYKEEFTRRGGVLHGVAFIGKSWQFKRPIKTF